MAISKISGCLNFRDLGNFKGSDGSLTKSGRLFRADCLSKLTEDDIAALKKMGVVFVIDLRSTLEVENSDYPLNEHEGIGYEMVSLSDELDPQKLLESMPGGLDGLYRDIVDRFNAPLMRVFSLILEHTQGGAVVFHCTAGKDRTGVVSALLLLLKGVSEEDIIADYAKSYENMRPHFEIFLRPMKMMNIPIPEHVFSSDPEYMAAFLKYFKEKYGSVEDFLVTNGMSEADIQALKNVL